MTIKHNAIIFDSTNFISTTFLTINADAVVLSGPVVGGAFADSAATWRWVRKHPPTTSHIVQTNSQPCLLHQPRNRRHHHPNLHLLPAQRTTSARKVTYSTPPQRRLDGLASSECKSDHLPHRHHIWRCFVPLGEPSRHGFACGGGIERASFCLATVQD